MLGSSVRMRQRTRCGAAEAEAGGRGAGLLGTLPRLTFLPVLWGVQRRGGELSRVETQEALSPVHYRASAPRAQVCGSIGV